MEIKKKLRVFEAFAGIGAQAAALKKLNINYEIVGISDWFIDAIECYASIHCEGKEVEVPKTKAEVLEYLSNYTFSADSVHPYNISRLSEDRLPSAKNLRLPQVIFSEIERLSSWARLDIIVISNSPLLSKV